MRVRMRILCVFHPFITLLFMYSVSRKCQQHKCHIKNIHIMYEMCEHVYMDGKKENEFELLFDVML
mgnify:CR=1 FL=1